jgi:hypothetical protein
MADKNYRRIKEWHRVYDCDEEDAFPILFKVIDGSVKAWHIATHGFEWQRRVDPINILELIVEYGTPVRKYANLPHYAGEWGIKNSGNTPKNLYGLKTWNDVWGEACWRWNEKQDQGWSMCFPQ